jgi:signal transduction histidine kinase
LRPQRAEILARWTRRIGREHADKELTAGELRDHLPAFFDQMLLALGSAEDSAEEVGKRPSAAHGAQRLRVGFDLVEVIREYEILTECILEEAEAVGGNVTIAAFKRVQRLLNDGRAEAVSVYISQRDCEVARAHSQHVAFMAHELRNPLIPAIMALNLLQKGARPEQEWALKLLNRSFATFRELIDQALITDRLEGEVQLRRELLNLEALLRELIADARLTAEQRRIELVLKCSDVPPFEVDHRLLRSAIGNVLGNAIKFSHDGGEVLVRAARIDAVVLIEIEDSCTTTPSAVSLESRRRTVRVELSLRRNSCFGVIRHFCSWAYPISMTISKSSSEPMKGVSSLSNSRFFFSAANNCGNFMGII